MADSPMNSSISKLAVSVLVDGSEVKESYGIESIFIEHEAGRISHARITFVDGDPAENTFPISESADLIPGKAIKIKLGYGESQADVFEGVILSQSIRASNYEHKNTSQLIVTCKDKAYKMDIVPKSAQFVKMKDSAVMSAVIGNAGLTADVKATDFEHPTIFQYQTTDWEFVLDRARANGHLVFCDGGKISVKPPDFSSEAALSLDYGSSVLDFQAELSASSQIKSATFLSWASSELKVSKGESSEPSAGSQGNITASTLASSNGDPILKLSGSSNDTEQYLKVLADAEVMMSRLARIIGKVAFVGSSKVVPGYLIELKGFGARFNGNALARKVVHDVRSGFWKTEVGFGMDYSAWKNPSLQGKKTLARLGGIAGLHTGVVKKIHEDPDGEFRVQVELPDVDETGEGVWAKLSASYASNEIGVFMSPEVGDEVVLGFLSGDARFPVILGALHSKKNPPPVTPDQDNSIKTIVTKAKLKMIFDDKLKVLTLETPNGQKIILSDDNDSLSFEDKSNNKIVMDSSGIAIKSAKDITFTADGNVTIKANQNLSMESSGGDVSLKGLNINSKANVAFKAEGAASAELKASGNVVVKGAIVNIN